MLKAARTAKNRDIEQADLQQFPTDQAYPPSFHDEWKRKQLREIGHFLKGSGVKRDDAQSGTLACVRYGEIYTTHHDFVRTFHSWISPKVAATAARIQYGDILFAGSGETKEEIGKCVAVVSRTEAYAGGDIVILRPRNIDPLFFGYALNMPAVARQKASLGQGDAVVHISVAALAGVIVNVPSIEEQTAIARVFFDVDALLDGLDRLIAKKQDLKQAVMQQLLTGQTRLPGFHGKWERKQLGEIGHFLKGGGVKRDDAQSGTLACLRYGEIYTTHHDFVRTFHSWISPEVAATAVRIQYGDILFAGSGETKEEIGKCVAVVSRTEAYAGGDIVILRPRNIDPLFFGYALNMPAVARQKASLGQGDAVVHISAASLANVSVDIPSFEEQTEIATILSDMDAEIAALEARRDKTRDLKEAMMQELLTGKTRLVRPEETHA